MRKVIMVTMVAVALSVSTMAFAWAGCGGGYCSTGNGGYGCYGFHGGNGWCSSMMSSTTSYIQAAANCCAGIFDFFKGNTNPTAAPGASRAQTL